MAKFLETATTKPPAKFRFITWNLDGLDDRNLKIRTKAVKKIIEAEQPDVVFLQEVVPKTLGYLEENLPQYKFIPGDNEGYMALHIKDSCVRTLSFHLIILGILPSLWSTSLPYITTPTESLSSRIRGWVVIYWKWR